MSHTAFISHQGFSRQKKYPVVTFNQQDLASTSNFGRKALDQLNGICEESFKKSVHNIIAETPNSKLVRKPSSLERQLQ